MVHTAESFNDAVMRLARSIAQTEAPTADDRLAWLDALEDVSRSHSDEVMSVIRQHNQFLSESLTSLLTPRPEAAPTGKVCAWCGITPVTDRRARCANCR